MRVALCFYGQPRKYKKVLDQWQKIIKELNADVFIQTWYGEDRGRNFIDINALIEDFQPKEIKVSNPHRFIDLIPTDSTYETQSYHAMQQAYATTGCLQTITIFSESLKTDYDLIIKARMDIELHNVDMFINFIKSNKDSNLLYVAGNHWQGHTKFDDNIMVGSANAMKSIYINFFKYTIDYINNTKIIPGGETNHFNWFESLNISKNVVKIEPLNFTLLVYQLEEIILNQNEIK
jgi:hypothetical protein